MNPPAKAGSDQQRAPRLWSKEGRFFVDDLPFLLFTKVNKFKLSMKKYSPYRDKPLSGDSYRKIISLFLQE
jgi:hypothetical protein